MSSDSDSLHYAEQQKRAIVACLAHGKVRSSLQDLQRNPEHITALEIAEGNAATLLSVLREALQAERAKRTAKLDAEFNGRTLFTEVRA